MNQGKVVINVDQGIGTISFDHPDHNALPGYLLAQLADGFQTLGADERAKIILLQSGGSRTFCAGAHFGELKAINTEEEGKSFFSGFAKVILAMRTCPKLIICRLQGKAVGGGVGLAAAADYAMATQYASIKLSELAIGIGPFVIGPAVQRKIGIAGFSQLTLNPTEWQTASWAKQFGLFQEVFQSNEQLDDYLQLYLSKMTSYSLETMRNIKQMLWSDTPAWDQLLAQRAATSGRLVLTPETQQILHADKA